MILNFVIKVTLSLIKLLSPLDSIMVLNLIMLPCITLMVLITKGVVLKILNNSSTKLCCVAQTPTYIE